MNNYKIDKTKQTRTASEAGHAKSQKSTTWKPEPCGLTREDLRRLVLEMVG